MKRNSTNTIRIFASLAGLLALFASHFTYAGPGQFTDVTEIAGVQYVQHQLDQTQLSEQENFSGSAAAGDYDGDGWVDLFVTRLDDTDILFRNLGGELGPEEPVRFEDVTAAAGIKLNAATNGGAWGDIDNDGDLDLYIGTIGHPRFYLYVNNGDGTFTEEGVARGVDLSSALEHQATSISFGDFDRDGWLDIHTNEWGIDKNDPAATNHSVLLRNRGAESPGHFEDATQSAGINFGANADHLGFSSAFTDLDDDDWPDLLVLSDFGNATLYWNNGNGSFTDGTTIADINQAGNAMGLSVGDYNADGLLDVFVTSIGDNRLYENQGDRSFVNRSFEYGVADGDWGWGAAFIDIENDRDLDLIMTNGYYDPASPSEVNAAHAIDPMRLWENIDGVFTESAVAYGVEDTRQGKGLLRFDYDRDGDLDVFVANNGDGPVLYRNDIDSGNNWLQLKFQGTRSNRQGIGAKVWLTAKEGESAYLQELTGGSHFLGQSEMIAHFGLEASPDEVDTIRIEWPSGIVHILKNVASDQRLLVVEPDEDPIDPPELLSQSESALLQKDEPLELTVESNLPLPIFNWYKDGELIGGATGSTFKIKRTKFFDAGSYTVEAINIAGTVVSEPMVVTVDWDISEMSIARVWNEILLDAIRKDFPAPTIHGRNLYHTSAAMWDAFWAYEVSGWDQALPAFHKETTDTIDFGSDREAAQRMAISYAAFRVLHQRYEKSVGKDYTFAAMRWLMDELGYDPDFTGTVGKSGDAVGNRIGYALIDQALNDGSNEANDYADTSGYVPSNDPLVLQLSGTTLLEPNLWQPLAFDFRITQNGIEIGENIQEFIGVNWQEVDTFAIQKDENNKLAIDPGPPPLLGTNSQQEFLDVALEVIRYSSYLDPTQSELIDVSPGGRLNNRLGENLGIGRSLNPITNLPYEENLVNLADYGRILAEFWADGPASETPPGHWNTLHNEITDDPRFERRYGGNGPELSALEWDIHAYLTINGAMHDAAIAAWTLKRQYDYVRPISIIRHLGALGQSSDTDGALYHPQGLPLKAGLVEIITEESAAGGERHAALGEHIGEIAIYAWAGEPEDPHAQTGGVDWILAVDWLPYQRDTFVTPAFAAYVSGHSTFSRAAAEVMTLLTGSSYFPGGMGEFTFKQSAYLEFEDGPSQDVTLQWATYYDAADQAGISRLYGGIHVPADDFVGRRLGARVGLEAFLKAHQMRYGALPLGGLQDTRIALGSVAGHTQLVEVGSQDPDASLPIHRTALPYDSLPAEDGIYVSTSLQAESTFEVVVKSQNTRKLVAWPTIQEGQQAIEARFELSGDYSKVILIRHLGESASLIPIPHTSAPQLELFSVSPGGDRTLIAENAEWIHAERASLIEVGSAYIGLSKLAKDSKDAGLVAILPAGSYLLRLSNLDQTEGASQFEIHQID